MYRKNDQPEKAPENFELPFEGKLAASNRWVIMAEIVPWSEFEAEYAANFCAEMGAPAKTFRMALGALIIKERLGVSDARNGRTNQRESIFAILSGAFILQR